MEWISVKDELPDIGEEVWVYENHIYYFDVIKRVEYGHHCKLWTCGDPTYWMHKEEWMNKITEP